MMMGLNKVSEGNVEIGKPHTIVDWTGRLGSGKASKVDGDGTNVI